MNYKERHKLFRRIKEYVWVIENKEKWPSFQPEIHRYEVNSKYHWERGFKKCNALCCLGLEVKNKMLYITRDNDTMFHSTEKSAQKQLEIMCKKHINNSKKLIRTLQKQITYMEEKIK